MNRKHKTLVANLINKGEVTMTVGKVRILYRGQEYSMYSGGYGANNITKVMQKDQNDGWTDYRTSHYKLDLPLEEVQKMATKKLLKG